MKIVTIWETSQGFFTRKEDCICHLFTRTVAWPPFHMTTKETPTEHYAIYDDGKYFLLGKPITTWTFPNENKENEES